MGLKLIQNWWCKEFEHKIIFIVNLKINIKDTLGFRGRSIGVDCVLG